MSPALRLTLLVVPLFALGFGAGALRALAGREGLAAPRRRALRFAWVATLLAGAPAWLLAAALLGLW